jgi:hypothetical protein
MAGSTISSSTDYEEQPAAKGKFSLENILGDGHESLVCSEAESAGADGWDEESTKEPAAEGYCIECEGRLSLYSICR